MSEPLHFAPFRGFRGQPNPGFRMKLLPVLLLVLLAGKSHAQTVGIEGQLDALLPAPELKAKPASVASPITLRIAATRLHGTLIQYDLRYIGLVPGEYDLRAYLLRDGGAPADDLPPLPVKITGILPADHRGELSAYRGGRFAALGGYRWMLAGIGALWILAALPLFLSRRRRKETAEPTAPIAPPTLADRLRPLVESATAGRLTADQQAQLERLLLAHWREKLGLEKMDASEAMPRLREHPEAGALLRTLEDWLHRRPGTVKVDVESVLAPYGKLSETQPPQPA